MEGDEASARSPKPEGLRAGAEFLGRGQRAPFPPARGSGLERAVSWPAGSKI